MDTKEDVEKIRAAIEEMTDSQYLRFRPYWEDLEEPYLFMTDSELAAERNISFKIGCRFISYQDVEFSSFDTITAIGEDFVMALDDPDGEAANGIVITGDDWVLFCFNTPSNKGN